MSVEVVTGPQPPPPLASRNPERNPSGAAQPLGVRGAGAIRIDFQRI
jgi:hypothetical protein